MLKCHRVINYCCVITIFNENYLPCYCVLFSFFVLVKYWSSRNNVVVFIKDNRMKRHVEKNVFVRL